MSKIKMWVNNRLDNEIEVDVNEIVKKFINSDYYELYNVNRYLPIFIGEEYKATFDESDYELIINKYVELKQGK